MIEIRESPMDQMSRDTPPPFPQGLRRRGPRAYPMGGVRTAPAWRAMWQALWDADGAWVAGIDLDEVGVLASGCAMGTAKQLLIKAADAGRIERGKVLVSGRYRVQYRLVRS